MTALNYGLGNPVNPGSNFTASNILLHERDFVGYQRSFQIELNPSVPETSSLALMVLGILGILAAGRLFGRGRLAI